MSAPHVVIIGGGFGGLYAAKALRRAPVRITLVDKHNHHLFQPMLYEVAGAALNPTDIAAPIRSVVRKARNTEVVLATVARIDAAGKRLEMRDGTSLAYDYLIAAPGLDTFYYGHDQDWGPLAPGLKSMDDALLIRQRVLMAFERAEKQPDPEKRHACLTFVVVGGGPTGVETAGIIAELRRFTLARDFTHIDPREATVMLLEGGPRILPSYPEHLSARAKQDLRNLGVDVRENTMVEGIRPGFLDAAGSTIPTSTVVWAAGVRASSLLQTLGTPLDKLGRAIVEQDCSVPGHPELFVIGDAVHFADPAKGDALPAVAPVAIQMGRHVARTIRDEIRQRPRTPFRYHDKGQVAVIGRGEAVADIWRFQFGGFIAWFIWAFVHIAFLIGFKSRVLVMLQWAWSYFSYQRGARLIVGPETADAIEAMVASKTTAGPPS